MLKGKILKRADTFNVENIVVMLYGQPGIGKTSLAFTASNPFCLDYDNGMHRSAFRKDGLKVSSWEDAAMINAQDVAEYDTIIVDTVGRLLDFLAVDLIRKTPKLGRADGGLSLQGYGALKSRFASWVRNLQIMGKDIIMVAHDKEDKKGDDLIIRPDIQGGSYAEVFKLADAVGYMFKSGCDKLLDFSPSDSYVGKNCAGFDVLTVPDFNRVPAYMGTLIQEIKDKINEMSEEQKKVVEAVDEFRQNMDTVEKLESINSALNALYNDFQEPVLSQCKRVLNDRAKVLGFVYKPEKKGFDEMLGKDDK